MTKIFRLGFAATTTLVFLIVLSASQTVSAQLIISEFRVRGPSGANDEFIELYNNSGADHTVAGGGTGYAVASSDGVARCVVPNGTVVPNRGNYLCTNSVAYSLGGYAAADATYTTDIPDNAGIAIFNTSVAGNFVLANRLDAVGSTSEANTLYKEGTGYPALTPFSIDYSFYRDTCGKSGSITTLGACSISTPKDTNNNAADFIFVDTNGTSAGAGQRLGAPGPENLASPIQRNTSVIEQFLDATVSKTNPPNRVRDFTSDPANNSTFGTLDIRRRIVNNTGTNVTRLRFRIIDITTFPAPSGFADLRARTSTLVVVSGINDSATCLAANGVATTPCTVNVQGTTLEQPPSQPNGSGFNGSLAAGTITLGTPLANGDSLNLRFLLGIQQTGTFKFYVNVDVLTGAPPVAQPAHQIGSKGQKWTDWKGPMTGITDEPSVASSTSTTSLVPASPGWFIVVPSSASTSAKNTEASPAREEITNEPSTRKARRHAPGVEASAPLTTEDVAPASGKAPVATPVALPLAPGPAKATVAAVGPSAIMAAPAANVSAPRMVSSKERRKSRRAETTARRRTMRRR